MGWYNWEMNDGEYRRRRSAEEMARMAEEFRGSGLSAADFARRAGVATPTVYQWLKRFPQSARFVPVRLGASAAPSSEPLRLVRPDGWRIEFPRGLSAAELQQLIQGLGGC